MQYKLLAFSLYLETWNTMWSFLSELFATLKDSNVLASHTHSSKLCLKLLYIIYIDAYTNSSTSLYKRHAFSPLWRYNIRQHVLINNQFSFKLEVYEKWESRDGSAQWKIWNIQYMLDNYQNYDKTWKQPQREGSFLKNGNKMK